MLSESFEKKPQQQQEQQQAAVPSGSPTGESTNCLGLSFKCSAASFDPLESTLGSFSAKPRGEGIRQQGGRLGTGSYILMIRAQVSSRNGIAAYYLLLGACR
jgi:hypothetical protein